METYLNRRSKVPVSIKHLQMQVFWLCLVTQLGAITNAASQQPWDKNSVQEEEGSSLWQRRSWKRATASFQHWELCWHQKEFRSWKFSPSEHRQRACTSWRDGGQYSKAVFKINTSIRVTEVLCIQWWRASLFTALCSVRAYVALNSEFKPFVKDNKIPKAELLIIR